MTPKSTRPTHRIYAVTKNADGKKFWQKIAAAWPQSDGDGFSLRLEYLPLNDAELVLRKPKADEAEASEGGAR